MQIPEVKQETVESIIEEVYAKNYSFGIDEFKANLETENRGAAIVLYSFIDAMSDYMAEDDVLESEKYSAIAKIASNLLYKSIEKQIEIDEM